MKKLFLLLLLILFTGQYSIAQLVTESCYFDQKLTEKLAESEQNIEVFNDMNLRIDQIIANNNMCRLPGDLHIIPVVVHVIHKGEAVGTDSNISDAQINSAIDNLTDTYRNEFGTSIDIEIEFQLAIRDPNCNVTNGIVRGDGSGVAGYTANGISASGPGADANTLKDLSKWNTDQYMNFWIVSEIDGNDGGAGIQGYANLPFAGYDEYDGSVMMASSFGYDPTNAEPSWPLNFNRDNSTPIHEVGHFLSLYHTFAGDAGGGGCPANVTVGTDSDGCADTPPHIRSNSTCPADGTNNPCSVGTLNEVKLNYMDYSSCPIKFTANQKDRMRATIEDPVRRGGLITSLALTPIAIAFVNPVAASCTPVTQADGLGGSWAGIGTTVFKQINISTGFANQDGGYIARSCSGVAYVELDEVVPLAVTVLGPNPSNLRVYIDYNNDGDFSDVGEEVHTVDNLVGDGTTNTDVIIPSAGNTVLNTHLRMRVIHDIVNNITNACHNPQYSQAEDFSVYITDNNNNPSPPIAAFEADDLTPCIDQEVTFDDLSTHTPTSWAWEITPAAGWAFTAGTNATSENPKVTFTVTGNFNVKLTATNASGNDDELKNTYITVHAAPNVVLTPTNASCGLNNGQIVAVVTGNTDAPVYEWNSGSITDTQTNLAAGNENLVITVDGCMINVNENIIANATPTVDMIPTQPDCGLSNGQIVAVVSGNIGIPIYAWSSGSITDTQTNLAVGNETLVVTVDGCFINANENLINVNGLSLNLVPTQPSCGLSNGQIVAVVTGNIAAPVYAWDSGSITDTQVGLAAGNVSVAVTVDGCVLNATETLIATTPTVILTGVNASCGENNGEITAVVSGNVTAPIYAWSSGSTTDTQTGLGAGNEILIVTVDGCVINESETLIALASPTITLTTIHTTCSFANGQVTATISGNTGAPVYNWDNGSTGDVATNLPAGSIILTTTVDGCTITESTNIDQSVEGDHGIIDGLTSICAEDNAGQLILSNYNENIVGWIYTQDQINWTVTDSTSSTYTTFPISDTTWFGAIVQFENCPHDTTFIQINTIPLPIVDAGIDQEIDLGNSTSFEGITNELIYEWSSTLNVADYLDLNSELTPTETTSYGLTATNSSGCVHTDSVTITVLTVWDYMTGIHVPNGFSPNGDGNNDLLDIFVGKDVERFTFNLYDRWGHQVFFTETNQILWDGTYKAKPSNTGVYAYKINVVFIDNRQEVIHGNVTLIR